MNFIKDDGGRRDAGFRGHTSDCVCRSIAIATGKSYREVYDAINMITKWERVGSRKTQISNARKGVYRYTYEKYLKSLGWVWVSTSGIGKGFEAHLTQSELPMGRLVVLLRGHLTSVIDHVIHDTWNPAVKLSYNQKLDDWVHAGVYGYFHKP